MARDFRPSPNAEPRREGRAVDMLILHYTGMVNAAAALERLTDPDSGVSCHYLVDRAGHITQMVGEDLRAWHAGKSFWRGERDINSRSIGIEIDNPGHELGYGDFPLVQLDAVAALCRDIASRHAIPPRHVLAHADVAPGRKIDPGERFDWRRLAAAGVGLWVEPEPNGMGVDLEPDELAEFQQLLQAFGYEAEVTGICDDGSSRATDAFQRHFRQALVNGIPDRSSLLTLERLVTACGTG